MLPVYGSEQRLELVQAQYRQGLMMRQLIVFSHLRWSFVYQRPQHLLSRLSAHYEVFFIEEPVYTAGEPRFERHQYSKNLEVLTPHTPVPQPGFHDDQLSTLQALMEQEIATGTHTDYAVWLYTPMALPLVANLAPIALVYDCMDELAYFKDAPRQLKQRENTLLKTADLVLTGGPSLYDAKKDLNPNAHCLPSSVDATHFCPSGLVMSSQDAQLAGGLHREVPRPRLGFFGVIDERFDVDLLATLADARPEWQFVMVGPVAKIDPGILPRRANIHWLGMQPYQQLPYLLAGWDVCLMPFAINDSTRFISPTKTLEYMAGEKPIVSTAVADVQRLYGEFVRIAADANSFIQACAEALNETTKQAMHRRKIMREAITALSWDNSAEKVHQLLDEVWSEHPAETQIRDDGSNRKSVPRSSLEESSPPSESSLPLRRAQ